MAEALYLLIRFVLSRYIEKGVDLVHQLMHTYEESEFCLLFKWKIFILEARSIQAHHTHKN